MHSLEHLAQRYIDVWNESDRSRRYSLLEETFADGARYTDPGSDAEGRASIDERIAGAQAQLPGYRFRLAGLVDTHHDVARFTWHLAKPGDADPLVIGFDVIVAPAGRIDRVHGFLDKVPAQVS